MRIALVAHGFPPVERTGVENHTAQLAAALSRAGHGVEVFVPRACADLAEGCQRRQVLRGPGEFGVTWVNLTHTPASAAEHLDRPGAAQAFDEFLERERPELVHFQHVQKLGVGLIEVASKRGLATVYTAHDYDPICHRTTLLRPDLTRCESLGRPEMCARCDRAAGLLNAIERLGDYQSGVLGEQLRKDEPERLEWMLKQDPPQVNLDQRRALNARRARAFELLDCVIAPTQFLAERLVEGGLARGSIEVMACGIDSSALGALPPPKITARRDLRFGYVGGISKHKGVHHLLDAFSRMRTGARLALFGDGSDQPYVEQVREQASSAGAAWMGAFESGDLAQVFSSIDVLVVPSIWFENAPFVIREAFAARRPVIASGVGALSESVRDGLDGLLVEPGDPDALARGMERLAREPELVEKLIEGILPPREIDDHARELGALYESLLARKQGAPAPVPKHARAFAERALELERLPERELFGRVVRGVSRLRQGVGVASGGDLESWFQGALDSATGAAERARDRRRELEWLRETVLGNEATAAEGKCALADEHKARKSLESERDWLLERLRQAEGERNWLREQVTALELRGQGLFAELEHERAQGQREQQRGVEAERAVSALREEAEWLRETLAALRQERDWLRKTLPEVQAERTWLKQSLAQAAGARGTFEQALSGLSSEVKAIGVHEIWLRGECAQLLRDMGEFSWPGAKKHLPTPVEVGQGIAAARVRLHKLRRELGWRRREMDEARREGGVLFRRLVERSKLGARLRAWNDRRGDQSEA